LVGKGWDRGHIIDDGVRLQSDEESADSRTLTEEQLAEWRKWDKHSPDGGHKARYRSAPLAFLGPDSSLPQPYRRESHMLPVEPGRRMRHVLV
jgi:hypothetical protein